MKKVDRKPVRKSKRNNTPESSEKPPRSRKTDVESCRESEEVSTVDATSDSDEEDRTFRSMFNPGHQYGPSSAHASIIPEHEMTDVNNAPDSRPFSTPSGYYHNHPPPNVMGQGQATLQNIPGLLENFAELFVSALADKRTIDSMTSMFTPLLDKHTSTLKKEIAGVKVNYEQQKEKIKNLEDKVNTLERTCVGLKTENETCYQILGKQQKFLEYIDSKDRVKNIIIRGVPEAEDELGRDDTEKITSILREIDIDIPAADVTHKRLGNGERNKRPISVQLPDKTLRQKILENAKTLKNKQAPFNRIYIKKDLHPAVN